ncbi:hypothetical protein PAMC26577_32860 [Caballeronia sordidicola]|uniref:Uncharacterized protein n=1 Tax=Caballeronia sordidicola TaxID=196367 RepID=A0A242MBQ7_CABSO|nr:hypothetical protein PAMC26577_32860 [Caballeronia sordidicola]
MPYSVVIAVSTSIIRLYQDETHAEACVSMMLQVYLGTRAY